MIGPSSLSFANQKEMVVNSTLLQVLESDTCKAHGEFRIVHINFIEESNLNGKIGVDISSVFFKIGRGIVGEGSVDKFRIDDLSEKKLFPNIIKCLDGNDETENLLIELNNHHLDSFYEVGLNGTSIGIVSHDHSNFKNHKETKTKNTFLIVTGADACESQGAYRLVNVNYKEGNNGNDLTEVDIASFFFKIDPKMNHEMVGTGSTEFKFESSVIGSDHEFAVINPIDCNDFSTWADEKFKFTLNDKGQANLDLPPI